MTDSTEYAGLKILVVENHQDTLRWLSLYLEDTGHKVEGVKTLKEGKKSLAKTQYDLLITDIGLPDGKGWELMSDKAAKKPPFAIAMSGYGMNSDSERTQAVGFNHHLIKPFKMQELDELLAKALKAKDQGERKKS